MPSDRSRIASPWLRDLKSGSVSRSDLTGKRVAFVSGGFGVSPLQAQAGKAAEDGRLRRGGMKLVDLPGGCQIGDNV